MDAVWRVGDLIATILDGDGVTASNVGDIGHSVGPVTVVSDVGLLGLPLRVLGREAGSLSSPPDTVENATTSYLVIPRSYVGSGTLLALWMDCQLVRQSWMKTIHGLPKSPTGGVEN